MACWMRAICTTPYLRGVRLVKTADIQPMGVKVDLTPDTGKTAVADIFADYAAVSSHRQNLHTRRNAARIVGLFREWCQGQDIEPAALTPAQANRYFAELAARYAPTTVRHHLCHLGGAYRYARDIGTIQGYPLFSVGRFLPAVPDKEPNVLDVATLRAVRREAPNVRANLLFHLLAYTGMRRIECRRLAWEDVNLETRTLRVMGKGKGGGKLRNVPIHPKLVEALIEGTQHRAMVTHCLGDAECPHQDTPHTHVITGWHGEMPADGSMQQWLAEMTPKGAKVSFHDFRRTVASSLADADVPTDRIDRIMGWAPRAVRSRYYTKHADAKLQDAILKLYGGQPL
jgi:integrase